jgi:hypothetical protein
MVQVTKQYIIGNNYFYSLQLDPAFNFKSIVTVSAESLLLKSKRNYSRIPFLTLSRHCFFDLFFFFFLISLVLRNFLEANSKLALN